MERNSSETSQDLEESVTFETTVPKQFIKRGNTSTALENLDPHISVDSVNSSSESIALENLDPHISVDKLGCDMKAIFSNWSKEFIPSKQFEQDTMKSLDDLKKQAYVLEVQFLENKLEQVKKRIT